MDLDLLTIDSDTRLRWQLPNGHKQEAIVRKVKEVTDEGITFYDEMSGDSNYGFTYSFLRCVRADMITHVGSRRVRKSSRQHHKPEVGLVAEGEPSNLLRLMIGEEPEMAKAIKKTAKKTTTKAEAKESDLATKTRKSLDDMSEAHRAHIEKWEPHLEALRGEHVWAAVMRVPGRGIDGPCYVAIKRGSKDYAIVDYDTEKMPPATPKRVLADGFESSSAVMEAFKEYRQMAKDERNEARAEANPPKAKKAAAKKAAPKRTAKPKRTVKRTVK